MPAQHFLVLPIQSDFCGIPHARTVAAATKISTVERPLQSGLVYSKGWSHNSRGPGQWGVACGIASERRSPRLLVLVSVIAFATFFGQRSSSADESGASFWSPGTFANLAAVPGEPGWSFSATYFHATLMGGATRRRRTRCHFSDGRRTDSSTRR